MQFYELTVAKVEKAGGNATSVYFSLPETLKRTFYWLPGQHLTIRLAINNEECQRRYSISSAPGQTLRITVKQIAKGRVSGFINKQLAQGDTILVAPPSGNFVLAPNAKQRRSHYFFAASSGITPIYSMALSMLQNEPDSVGYLLYGNKDHKHTIFAQSLARLQSEYPERFFVFECHSSASWFKESPWRSQRIDAGVIADFIRENPPYAQDCQYYLCGPGEFLPNVRQALNNLDVPDSRIHMESFGSRGNIVSEDAVEAILNLLLNGTEHKVSVAADETLLQAMLRQNVAAPYSCEGGVCGTCRCRLTAGKVKMQSNYVLTEQEVGSGEILACQSIALSKELNIKYGHK